MVDRFLQFLLLCVAVGDGFRLGFQFRESLFCGVNPWFKLVPFQVALLIGVDKTSDPSPHAGNQPHELLGRAPRFLPPPAQATLKLAPHPLGIGEE